MICWRLGSDFLGPESLVLNFQFCAFGPVQPVPNHQVRKFSDRLEWFFISRHDKNAAPRYLRARLARANIFRVGHLLTGKI